MYNFLYKNGFTKILIRTASSKFIELSNKELMKILNDFCDFIKHPEWTNTIGKVIVDE